jgi:hypothetical protein
MAKCIVDGENANGQQFAESYLLYLRIWESQSKWEEILHTLEEVNEVDDDKKKAMAWPNHPHHLNLEWR